ncbi:MAG: ATP-binding protein [Bacteroidales bacterium]|nr:ATP-binding protein [Bacteroidales bacterium]
MTTSLQNLPIGVQDFEKLRRENYLYIDKTALIYRLATTGNCYFLSRPRRFGKSLLLSTLKAYFLGKKELFHGLAIESLESDWKEHPVLYLDLNSGEYRDEQSLRSRLNFVLHSWEDEYGVGDEETELPIRFEGVIRRAYEKTGRQVVILVDEYEKPLLEAIEDSKLQDTFRNILRAFYSVLKSMDACIRFALLTGVTKFGHLSIFSSLNNLNDISMSSLFFNICGIDNQEMTTVLRPYVDSLAEKVNKSLEDTYAEIKHRYDGYHFSEDSDGVYNPFSVLNCLYHKKFGSFWFSTGTPSYLVTMLKSHDYNLERLTTEEVTANILSTIESDNPIPLLFQSGYLTIKNFDPEFSSYSLGFPNEEVREGFFNYIMPSYVPKEVGNSSFQIMNFVKELRSGRVDDFMTRLKSFLAESPYLLVRELENHYQNVLYILCNLCGLYTRAEYHTSQGRIDMTIETDKYVYIFEFKFDKTAELALQQIKDNNYVLPFQSSGKKIVCLGVNFSSKIRNIDNYLVE